MPSATSSKMIAPSATLAQASKTYQSIVGFGGAFTEAAAINWRSLSPEDQEKVALCPLLPLLASRPCY